MQSSTETPEKQARLMSRCNVPTGATEVGKETIRNILRRGCRCGSDEARVTQRTNRVGVSSVAVQCAQCGASLGAGIKRADHPLWQSYPNFDDGLRDRYWAASTERWELKRQQDEEERLYSAAVRRQNYADWLATSLEWRAVRGKVLERSSRICEACLSTPAGQVHHVTYSAGKLPPAWLLRAVCSDCHARLHDDLDEWLGE